MGGMMWKPGGAVNQVSSDVHIYDPVLNSWKRFPSNLCVPRGILNGACFDGKLFAIGGANAIPGMKLTENEEDIVSSANLEQVRQYTGVDTCSIPESTFYFYRKK
jgi:hypothetical protein